MGLDVFVVSAEGHATGREVPIGRQEEIRRDLEKFICASQDSLAYEGVAYVGSDFAFEYSIRPEFIHFVMRNVSNLDGVVDWLRRLCAEKHWVAITEDGPLWDIEEEGEDP